MADLYPRLERKQRGVLLQILAKRIIVNSQGEIIEHELNSPFVYLSSLLQNLSSPGSGNGGLENVGEGSYPLDMTHQNSQNVEEFVAALHFEQRGKLEMVPIDNFKSHRV